MNDHDIHNELENLKEFRVFDVEHEWGQFINKIDQNKIKGETEVTLTSTKEKDTSAKVFGLPRYATAIAASLLILIVSTLAFLNLQQEEPAIVQQPKIQTEEIEDVKEVVAEEEIADVVEVPNTPTESVVNAQKPRSTAVDQTYERTPDVNTYNRTPEVITYEKAPEVTTYERTPEVITYKQAPEPAIAEAVPVEVSEVFKTYLPNQSIILGDGTIVTFVETSTIKVTDDFEGKAERNVSFDSGDAIFDVASNPDKPFHIVTDNSGITILGTSFEMVKGGIETSIKTFEGKVKLFSLADPTIEALVTKGKSFKFDGNEITEIFEEGEEAIEPEEDADLDMGTYNLQALCNSWNAYYGDNVTFKDKVIDKSLLTEPFKFPNQYVTTGKPENITKGLTLLKKLFKVDVDNTGACEHCYKINSIGPKS